MNRLVERNAAESNLFGFLKRRPEEIEAELARTRGETAASRDRFKTSTSDVVNRLASRFGISPGLSEAAGPGIGRQSEDLLGRETEALSLERSRATRENVNRTFTTLANRLAEAGIDRATAENVSRQFVLDEKNRKFFAEEAEADRGQKLKEQDIKDAYADTILQMQRQAAEEQRASSLKNSLIRSLFGFAATVGTATAIDRFGGGRTNKPGEQANYSGTYAGRLRESFNRQDVRPYTSDFGTRGKVRFP